MSSRHGQANFPPFHRDLRAELDANPGVVIRDRRVVPVEQLGTITHHGVGPMLSSIAVLYRLLTPFPQRFPQEDDQSFKIWGFTHNNWQASLFVFRAFKKRRATNIKSDNSAGERDSLDAIWYGTVAEQRSLGLAGTRSPTAEAGNATRDTSIAHSHQGNEHGSVNGVKVEDEDEGSNDVFGNFKIAMAGSVVIDPQKATAASSAAQGSGGGLFSWFRGN
ncbi:hypothetical protein FALCPG4_010203 [Fusarium falciforme]